MLLELRIRDLIATFSVAALRQVCFSPFADQSVNAENGFVAVPIKAAADNHETLIESNPTALRLAINAAGRPIRF